MASTMNLLDLMAFDKEESLIADDISTLMSTDDDFLSRLDTDLADQLEVSNFWTSFLQDHDQEDIMLSPEGSISPFSVDEGYVNSPPSADPLQSTPLEYDVPIDIGADVTVTTSENDYIAPSQVTVKKEKSSEADFSESKYSKLVSKSHVIFHLNPEERQLFEKEGLPIPSYPFTKEDEKNVKRIRRKIRNKHSAQMSRIKKKEFVDELKNKIKYCTFHNQELNKRVKLLEKENSSLMEQIKNLRTLLANTNKPAHSTTCAMVLLVSFALLLFPNYTPESLLPSRFQLTPKTRESTNKLPPILTGRSRSLLYSPLSPRKEVTKNSNFESQPIMMESDDQKEMIISNMENMPLNRASHLKGAPVYNSSPQEALHAGKIPPDPGSSNINVTRQQQSNKNVIIKLSREI